MEWNGKLTVEKISKFIEEVEIIDLFAQHKMTKRSLLIHRKHITDEEKRVEFNNMVDFARLTKLRGYDNILFLYGLTRIRRELFESLTDREKDVYRRVISGAMPYKMYCVMRDSLSKDMETIDNKFVCLIYHIRKQLPKERLFIIKERRDTMANQIVEFEASKGLC